jgi:hypothetical protein
MVPINQQIEAGSVYMEGLWMSASFTDKVYSFGK